MSMMHDVLNRLVGVGSVSSAPVNTPSSSHQRQVEPIHCFDFLASRFRYDSNPHIYHFVVESAILQSISAAIKNFFWGTSIGVDSSTDSDSEETYSQEELDNVHEEISCIIENSTNDRGIPSTSTSYSSDSD
jgi:hypothetical protein